MTPVVTRQHWGPNAETGVWQYGEAGDRYQVQSGDIWAVGKHRLVCGDLEQGDVVRRAVDQLGISPAMGYTDPPYNTNLATGFRTKAGMPAKVQFTNFLEKLIAAQAVVKGDFYIEMGNKTVDQLKLALKRAGAGVYDHWDITYGRTSPAALVRCNWGTSEIGSGLLPMFANMDDEITPSAAIAASSAEGDYVLDACLGRGLTATTAHKHGRWILGTELHPRRMAVSIERLVKLGAGDAEKIGVLN